MPFVEHGAGNDGGVAAALPVADILVIVQHDTPVGAVLATQLLGVHPPLRGRVIPFTRYGDDTTIARPRECLGFPGFAERAGWHTIARADAREIIFHMTELTLSLSQAIELLAENLRAGNLDVAEQIGAQLIRQAPDDGTVLALMAWLSHRTGRYTETDTYWRRSIDAGGDGSGQVAAEFTDAAMHSARQGLCSLRDALAMAMDAVPPRESGNLRKRIWDIERMLGANNACFSQAGQDEFIDRFILAGKTGGVFVDIGGHDGVTGSNTWFFEKFRNWTGICVEAAPALFAAMTRHRSAECLNVAVSNFEGAAVFLEITRGLHQMGGLVADLRPGFREVVENTDGNEGHEIRVPVTTLGKIAFERTIRQVDYCSIDVEGAELKVLEGIDFDYTHIQVISVENPPDLAENFDRIRSFMADRHYRLAGTFASDDIFEKA